MPDGYRRQPYVLESPYFGIGAGLGNIVSSYFEAKRGKKEAAVQDFGKVFSHATLTGSREVLSRAIDENPEAAEEFRRRTGIDVFRMTLPEVEMPPTMPLKIPPAEELAELPPVREMFADVVAPPGSIMPPAMVSAPQPEVPTGIPWPAEPQGMQVRAMQEQIAGRELPPGIGPKEPSPMERALIPFEKLGGVLSKFKEMPTLQSSVLQAVSPFMPPGLPTEMPPPPEKVPGIRDVQIFDEVYPNASLEERASYIGSGTIPTRPGAKEKTMTTAQFLTTFWDYDEDEWRAFWKEDEIPDRVPTQRPDSATLNFSFYRLASEVARLTDADLMTVYGKMTAGAGKEDPEWTKIWNRYKEEKVKEATVQQLRFAVQRSMAMKNNAATEGYLRQLYDLAGIPWIEEKTLWDKFLEMMGWSAKYAPGPMETEFPTGTSIIDTFKEKETER